MKLSILILSLLFLFGCNRYPSKELIVVPNENFKHDETKLKTDGYYHFKYISSDGGCYVNYGSDSIREKVFYNIKDIKTIVIYNDGAAYHSGRIGYSNAIDNQECQFIDSLNTYEQLRRNFENQVINKGLNDDEDYGWYNTGVFYINSNEIVIQIYHGAGWVDAYSSVSEYKGQIVNSELIRIEKIKNLKDNSIDLVNMEFEFVKFEGIKPVNNYIIKNRHKFGER